MKQKYTTYTGLPIISKGKIYKEEQETKNSFKIVTILVIVFIIIFLLLCGYSMAKVTEQFMIKTDAQMLEPILIIENDLSINITKTENYGVYSFKIKNYNEQNKITETNLKYYIEILYDSDNLANIELFENENKINLTQNRSDYIEISNNEKQEKEYEIKISYDKQQLDMVSEFIEKIEVKVHAEQVKG